MKPLALIGGGGHAGSLLQMMPPDMTVVGYVDRHPVDNMEVPYLGTDEEFRHTDPHTPVHIALVWGNAADMRLRRKLIELYRSNPAPTLTASSAIITPGSHMGIGCAIMHRTIINGATVGDYCVINTGAIIEHGVTLGENVFIGPGAIVCGGVTIGADTIIGAGAVIRNGVSVAAGTTVGMGAVVVSDITVPGVYVGLPAKLKG